MSWMSDQLAALVQELLGTKEELSWTCHVCGAMRPDALIGVAHRPLKYRVEQFPDLRFNVRYCTDNRACDEFAHAEGPWTGPPPRPPKRPSPGTTTGSTTGSVPGGGVTS